MQTTITPCSSCYSPHYDPEPCNIFWDLINFCFKNNIFKSSKSNNILLYTNLKYQGEDVNSHLENKTMNLIGHGIDYDMFIQVNDYLSLTPCSLNRIKL